MDTTIKLGQCWIVQMSKIRMAVRIDDYEPKGGWVARSLSHGRKVWIKSAKQLIRPCDSNGLHKVADKIKPNRRSILLPPEPVEVTAPAPTMQEEAVIHRLPFRKPKPEKPATLLDAAAMVLKENRKGMSTREIIAAIEDRELWTTVGNTPWLTLHTALSRDMATHGGASRFKKGKERGKFTLR